MFEEVFDADLEETLDALVNDLLLLGVAREGVEGRGRGEAAVIVEEGYK